MKTTLALSLVLLPLAAISLSAAPAAENWTALCAKCHGADGAGKTTIGKKLKLKDYTDAGVQAAMTDEEIVKAIKEGITDANGKDKMKAYKDLSDQEVQDLLALIRSQKK